jgi:hypothetical protein
LCRAASVMISSRLTQLIMVTALASTALAIGRCGF